MSLFIEKHKNLYRRLSPCYCPAIDDTVHFTAKGLHHLLYKRRRPRSHNERHYRMSLIPYLEEAVCQSQEATMTISSDHHQRPATIWELRYSCWISTEYILMKVILIKEGAGKVYFLSAMTKRAGISKKVKKANKAIKKPR